MNARVSQTCPVDANNQVAQMNMRFPRLRVIHPTHSKATDIQIDRILAPDDIHQVLGWLPGGDRQGGQMLLLAEKAAFDIAGLSVHY